MGKAIDVSDISGDSVYGISRVEYIVDGFTFVKSVDYYYGISIQGLSSTMVRGDVQKALTEVQYQIDKEDNLLAAG